MLLNSKKAPNNKNHQAVIAERIAAYDDWVKNLRIALAIKNIVEVVRVVNAYMDYAKTYEFEVGSIYKTHTKYYSSILEELPVHIVEDVLKSHLFSSPHLTNDFYLGCYNCVVRVGAAANGEFFQEFKMIDFAIALKKTFIDKELYVPLLGLEVKKYLDKTMANTVEHTRRVLSDFRPKTYYGFLAEDEARAKDVVANSAMYNREFILTTAGRQPEGFRNLIGVSQMENLVKTLQTAAIAAVDSTVI